jgi:hypothetical protein
MESLKIHDASWTNTIDVYIQVSFTKIYDIDTVNQRFQAEAIIETKWYDPSADSLDQSVDAGKIWRPDIYIDNAINDLKEDVSYKIVPDMDNKPMVCEIRKIKGLLWEKVLEN